METSPEDIAGMVAAQGILTTRGGMTSHAAVVARGMGKCCVAGCGEVDVDYRTEQMKAKGYVLKKGDVITLDGSTGEVFLGEATEKQVDTGAVLVTKENMDTPEVKGLLPGG